MFVKHGRPARCGPELMKTLIADDSRTIRQIQKNILRQLGYKEVLEAEDGLAALTLFKEHAPDLLIVDWNMPGMDGLDLVRKIRETNRSVPIIMCTTEAERSRVIEAVRAGVTSYVVKPFTPESLGEKIRQTLSRTAGSAA